MRSHLRINRLLPLLLLIALLAGTVARAQDATVEATSAATAIAVVSEPAAGAADSGDISATGLALGVLLLGLGAVAAVGGLNWLRDNYKRPEESE